MQHSNAGRGIQVAVAGLSALFLVASAHVEAVAQAPQIRDGLNAEFYGDTQLMKLVARRIDPNIECFFDYNSPIAGAPVDKFSIRWKGWIRAPRPGRYKLIFWCDDGVKLWIDQKLVLDEWKVGTLTHEVSVELSDSSHAIQVEYFDSHHYGFIAMFWQPLGSRISCPVPAEAFSPDKLSAEEKDSRTARQTPQSGLLAEYFDPSFVRNFGSGTAFRTEAIWSFGAPNWNVPVDAGVRYSGFLVPPASGEYKFVGWADDRLRVWIDNELVLESSHSEESAIVTLQAGRPTPLRIMFSDIRDRGAFRLHWVPPQESTQGRRIKIWRWRGLSGGSRGRGRIAGACS